MTHVIRVYLGDIDSMLCVVTRAGIMIEVMVEVFKDELLLSVLPIGCKSSLH